MSRYFCLIVLFCVLLIRCSPTGVPVHISAEQGSCSIVVDLGPYRNAEEASASYTKVDWFDDEFEEEAICTDALAAIELRRYLCRIMHLPPESIAILDDEKIETRTVIFLGRPTANPDLEKIPAKIRSRWKRTKSQNPQGFRLDSFTSENRDVLVLSGRTPVGTLYATYELLDRLGVRWIGPEKEEEFVPHRAAIDLPPLAEYCQPVFDIRGFTIEARIEKSGEKETAENRPDRADSTFYRWMGRNRLNVFWHRESDYRRLKRYGILLNCGGYAYLSRTLNPTSPYPYDHIDFTGDEKKPIDPFAVSKKYKNDENGDGTLSYYEAHPDWYGEQKIQPFFPSRSNSALFCTADNESLVQWCEKIVNMLVDGPWFNVDIYDFWPREPENWCSCDICLETGNIADRLLLAIDELHRAIRRARAEKRLRRDIQIFAVIPGQTPEPPTRSLPKDFDFDHTALLLLPSSRCYNHALCDTNCTEANAPWCENLKLWLDKKRIFRGKILIGEHYNDITFHDLPVVMTNIIGSDIPHYAEMGVGGIVFEHVRTERPGVHKLLNYQFARFTEDPGADVDSCFSEYLIQQYPGVTEFMKNYYEYLQQAMANIKAWKWELRYKLKKIMLTPEKGPVLPLDIFAQHFSLEKQTKGKNEGVNWESTYHLIFTARISLEEALNNEIPDGLLDRLIEIEYQHRYAELTITLYDNFLRALTLSDDEPEMREEAIIRLQYTSRMLEEYKIHSPALGISNGLTASEIGPAVDHFLKNYREEIISDMKR